MERTRRRPDDPSQSHDRVQAAHDTLTALVEALQSGQDWQRALSTGARILEARPPRSTSPAAPTVAVHTGWAVAW